MALPSHFCLYKAMDCLSRAAMVGVVYPLSVGNVHSWIRPVQSAGLKEKTTGCIWRVWLQVWQAGAAISLGVSEQVEDSMHQVTIQEAAVSLPNLIREALQGTEWSSPRATNQWPDWRPSWMGLIPENLAQKQVPRAARSGWLTTLMRRLPDFEDYR